MSKITSKFTPCLWFDTQAEEAANFYTSIFKDSKILNITRYGETGEQVTGQKQGSVMTVTFDLEGQEFYAMNAGPVFKFNEAISFIINCENQEEVDRFWEKLTADGGKEQPCGWVKDKFGLSWQVTPRVLLEMQEDKDPRKTEAVMQAMVKMKKLDIKTLKQAYESASAEPVGQNR